MDFILNNIWLIFFVVWGLPLTYYRSKFRKIIYPTDSWVIFAKKHRLNYTLLSDKGNKVRKLFGVPANFFGLIPGRVTYVIGKEGKVVYVFNSQT